jgi:hypothetical protein
MRRSFVARWNMRGICFSIVPAVKVLVHKIPSCFAFCNVEFFNRSYLILYANLAVPLHLVLMMGTPPFTLQLEPTICLEICPIWYQFLPVFPQLTLVLCMFASVYNGTCCFKPLYVLVKCYLIWNILVRKLSSGYTATLFVRSVFNTCIMLESRDKLVPVTTAWRVLRLRMEEQLRISWIRSRGQPTRGGPPAWGLARC